VSDRVNVGLTFQVVVLNKYIQYLLTHYKIQKTLVDVTGFEPVDNNNRSITFGQYCPWKRAPADTRFRASSLHPQPYRQYYLRYHQFYLVTFMSIILGGDTPFASVRPKLFKNNHLLQT